MKENAIKTINDMKIEKALTVQLYPNWSFVCTRDKGATHRQATLSQTPH